MTFQMKAIEQYFYLVLFIMLWKVFEFSAIQMNVSVFEHFSNIFILENVFEGINACREIHLRERRLCLLFFLFFPFSSVYLFILFARRSQQSTPSVGRLFSGQPD